MLDFYTSISRKSDLCGVFEDAEGKRKKILFKGTAKECMEYILEKEPDNQPILRQYKLNWGSEKNMKNRYWFTNDDGENILNDFHGTEQEAIKYAEEQANALGQTIYINCGEDIVDVAYA